MTTFVPLAADTDGTASAVAVGEWLLHSEQFVPLALLLSLGMLSDHMAPCSRA